MISYLLTGGSGYLGNGIAAELLRRGCERICIYSRDEAKHAKMRAAFANDSRLRFFLGDVRDLERLKLAMRGCSHVVHAAALKRVDAIEYNVIEGFATNVWGSENVVRAAMDAGVERCVLVSTDKACEPTTTYGITKAGAEAIFRGAKAYAPNGMTFTIVRYGNVAGSTGSVIPVWRQAMAEGRSCEIRDPDATRFWMTRDEAVSFVLDAAENGKQGELRVPTLPAYRLGDLALAMGVRDVHFTRLVDGEKQAESMLPGEPSSLARRMTHDELIEGLKHV